MAKKRATVSLRKPSPAPEVEAPEKPAAAVEGAVSVVAMASSEPEPVTAAPVAPVMPAAPEVMSIETFVSGAAAALERAVGDVPQAKLLELMDRYKHISINDSNLWATMALPHARHLANMLELARVITLGALNRNESRGAHYKPEFPDRDDDNFLKTTIAEYSGEGPVFSYDPVDISLIQPRKRDYSKGKKETAKA